MENEQKYNRPSWDEYFMNIVKIIGERGTCDRGRSGCVITKDRRIIATGYVGSPIGIAHCDDVGHEMHTVNHEDGRESRHCIRTTHAEQNAICQAARVGVSLKDGVLYCKMTPCYVCAKMIINTGIKKVICEQDYHAGDRSKEIFAEANIEFKIITDTMTIYDDMTPRDQTRQKNKELNMENSISNNGLAFENIMSGVPASMAKIFLYDEFNPEDTAMMQALYSRSAASVVEHVEKVKQSGSGKFMEKFYVGYGHHSIADCGSTTLFIEGLSMLADKAVQDWPLYAGQETSTRYVDMSKQPIIDPVKTFESKAILKRWMDFYLNSSKRVIEHLRHKYPRQPEEQEKIYEKALQARSFDILRGFLPAGITTQLSWHTNLRQAWDKLALLRHNPLGEVRDIANKMHKLLKEKYSHSFSHELDNEQEEYRKESNDKYNYYNPSQVASNFSYTTSLSTMQMRQYDDIIQSRSPKTCLPHFLSELGQITFDFLLDFGSFRDIQRHRNGVCRMPLLTTNLGFNQWYLDQLPSDLRQEAEQLIIKQKEAINSLNTTAINKQYYIAMGFNVACRTTYALPAAVYVLELRSGIAVHPTLRKIAHQMHHAMLEIYPEMKLYTDLDLDDWDVRRGAQDITQRTDN